VNQAIKEFGVELRDNDIDSIGEGSETRERAFDRDTLSRVALEPCYRREREVTTPKTESLTLQCCEFLRPRDPRIGGLVENSTRLLWRDAASKALAEAAADRVFF